MITCPSCGTENPAGFRFCGNCAAPLGTQAAATTERRKVVTVLFCDVVGSTSLGEQRDPESMRAVMRRYFETARVTLERHGGTVEKFIGDAVMAVFGQPVVHEDDALRAVRAAAELQAGLAQLNERLREEWGIQLEWRIGINTGPVVAGLTGAETLVTGDTVNVAARLQTAATPGQALLGDQTYQLVRDAVVVEQVPPLALKGKELPVPAWRLLAVEHEASLGRARHLDSPLVGRQRELRLLDEAFEQAVSERTCVLFTLLGPAGVGKSRLVHEFLAGLHGRAHVLRGRCLPYGEGITFWPLAEVVKQAAGIDETVSAQVARQRIEALVSGDAHATLIARHVAGLLGLDDYAGSVEELFWAVRRLLELIAADQPLVVVFDDIHWAESTFLDLLENLSDWSRDAPLLILCVARPELLDARTGWAGGKLNATTHLLKSLSDEHVGQLIENLLGEVGLADAIRRSVAEAAEGNPLFVEEFVAMLIDDGRLSVADGRWLASGDLRDVPVPATINALLAARLDRLAPPERRVIERASVVGKVFWRGAVAELAPEPVRAEVGPSLQGLVRKELVRPDRSEFVGDEAFRFRHLLVRDAAYDGLPKQERVELHRRFADWLERMTGERAHEYDEVLGYHLEQAYRYRLELGPLDDAAHSLATRAGQRLADAGRRALEHGDAAAATKLLERAGELLPESPARLEASVTLVEALQAMGRLADVQARLDELAPALAGAEPRLRWRAANQHMQRELAADPEGVAVDMLSQTEEVMSELAAAGDFESLADVWNTRGTTMYFLGRLAEARECHERSLEYARRAGSDRLEGRALTHIAAIGVWDDTPVDDAIERAGAALEWTRRAGSRLDEASTMGILGRLHAMRGEFDEARRLVAEARTILAELGRRVHNAGASHWTALVEMFAGEYAAQVSALQAGIVELEELGERSYLSSSYSDMALGLYELRRFDESEAAARRARELAASDDMDVQATAAVVQALIALQRGRLAEADKSAQAALELADRSALSVVRAMARYYLALVYLRTREPAAATELLGQALAINEAKGVSALLPRIRARLAEAQAQGEGGAAAAGA